jgi:hypothetical protein
MGIALGAARFPPLYEVWTALSRENSRLQVIKVTTIWGPWATLAQRLAGTVIFTYAVGRPQWAIESLLLLLSPVLLVGCGEDRLVGKRGGTLDHVLVARKPDD